MFDDTLSNGIIRSEQYLTGEAKLPPVGREAEIHAIRDAVRPLTKRNTPENLLVHGPPGSGKTACVNHVFDALERESGIKPVHINCWQYRTRPALLTELLIQLGYPAPRKGKPVDDLLKKLRGWLRKNRSIAVALDEFDQLQDKTEIVYDLHMLSQQTENKLGMVLISNLPPDDLIIDSRSWSRLNSRTVEFQAYTAEELQSILEAYIEQAFIPGAVSGEVVDSIAQTTASAGGDCRKAFKRLLQAGRQAAQEGDQEVTQQHLTEIEG